MTSQGEVLTDITTFAFAQRIFNDQKNVEAAYFKNLEFIIQLLLFNEKIWIVQPTYFGKKIEIENPDILTQLINQDIIQIYSPEYYKDTKDFLKSEYLEMIKIGPCRNPLRKY